MIFDEFLIKSLVKKYPTGDTQSPHVYMDLSAICANPRAFRMVIDAFTQKYVESNISHIAAVEANAFQFAAPIAYNLNIPLIFIRKNKSLPGNWIKEPIIETTHDFLTIEQGCLPENAQVLLFDDCISSGNSIRTASTLMRGESANIENVACILTDSNSDAINAIQNLELNLFSLLSI